jgi:hypothetical protein
MPPKNVLKQLRALGFHAQLQPISEVPAAWNTPLSSIFESVAPPANPTVRSAPIAKG